MARADLVAKGLDAGRILNDPAYNAAFEAVERKIIAALADSHLDGSPETNAAVVELVRDLQANRRLKATLVQAQGYGSAEAKRQEMAETQSTRATIDPRRRN